MDEKINWIYMFLTYRISIKIMDEYFYFIIKFLSMKLFPPIV
jgi:hypothetical protein